MYQSFADTGCGNYRVKRKKVYFIKNQWNLTMYAGTTAMLPYLMNADVDRKEDDGILVSNKLITWEEMKKHYPARWVFLEAIK